ncbi:hypothetical protein QE152_g15401 [Popillia japonica]|uniref:Uncharacterized protein n=1 Tax=Popillia japonica TaxID=7064 RepID=A0AAW1L8B3_POPJA
MMLKITNINLAVIEFSRRVGENKDDEIAALTSKSAKEEKGTDNAALDRIYIFAARTTRSQRSLPKVQKKKKEQITQHLIYPRCCDSGAMKAQEKNVNHDVSMQMHLVANQCRQ